MQQVQLAKASYEHGAPRELAEAPFFSSAADDLRRSSEGASSGALALRARQLGGLRRARRASAARGEQRAKERSAEEFSCCARNPASRAPFTDM